MSARLAQVSLLVRDYDEAIAFFTQSLGFVLREDTPLAGGKRWVVVAPRGGAGASLLLARAATPEQHARIGDHAGGRVFLFLHTDDFARDHAAFSARGVRFVEGPRDEPYGRIAVFLDLYGNKWDLVQARAGGLEGSHHGRLRTVRSGTPARSPRAHVPSPGRDRRAPRRASCARGARER